MRWEKIMEYVKRKLKDIRPYENNPRIIDDAVDDVSVKCHVPFIESSIPL